jgi:hypothetical protein
MRTRLEEASLADRLSSALTELQTQKVQHAREKEELA